MTGRALGVAPDRYLFLALSYISKVLIPVLSLCVHIWDRMFDHRLTCHTLKVTINYTAMSTDHGSLLTSVTQLKQKQTITPRAYWF